MKLDAYTLLFVFCMGCMLFSGKNCMAQEQPSTLDTPEDDAVQLEQIIVTSQKTESTRQQISSNVSVFDGTTLEDLGTGTIEQIVGLTPNISFYRPDNRMTTLVYRGIGGTTNMNKAFNVSYDGVIIPYVALNTALDIERIEMLRNSLGALYGANTHAGVINVVTRQPSDIFEGYAQIGYGSYNSAQFQSAFGGPAGRNMKYRLALGYQKSDGYFKNTYLDIDDGNDSEQISVNGKFIFQTPGAGEFTLGLLMDSFDDGCDNAVADGGYDTLHNHSGYNDGSVVSPTLTWKKQTGNVSFTSITNYSHSNYGFLTDWDHVPQDLYMFEFDETYNTYTEEFRVEADNGEDLKWMAGIFLMTESMDSDGLFWYGADAPALYSGMYQGQDSTVDTNEAALFSQVTYGFLPEFEVTVGLRLDYTRKDMTWTGISSYCQATEKSFDGDWFGVLPSAAIAWLPQKNQRVYLSVSQGFKAGDYNNVQFDADVVTQAVDPEYTTTYETGYKGVFADNRLELNLAAFYIDWEDMQVDSLLGGYNNMYIKQNAAKAHSSGIELEIRSKVARGLTAFFGAGYMFEYEFDEYPDSSAGDLSGKKLPATNEYNVGGGFVWRFGNGFFLSSNIRLYGPKFFDEANLNEQDSYVIVDAKAGYETEKWAIELYSRNLLDEEYIVNIGASQAVETSGEPLVGGVKLNWYF